MAADIVSLVQDQLLTKRNKTEEKLNEVKSIRSQNYVEFIFGN